MAASCVASFEMEPSPTKERHIKFLPSVVRDDDDALGERLARQRGGLATHLYFNSKRAVVSRDERGGRASKYCATDGKEVGDRQQEGPCLYGRDQ